MANWNLPTITSLYADVISFFKARDEDLATMFNTLPTNPITNTVVFNRANSRWENWNGASYEELDTEYAINVTHLGGQLASYYTNLANATGILPAASFNDTAHGNRGGGSLHALATTSAHGFMSSTDKTKLNGIEDNATADQTGSEILALLLPVDGAGSSLDADLLDGVEGSSYARSDAIDTISAVWTYSAIPAFNGGASGVSAPFTVDSNFLVTNLNADLLDGNEASAFALSSHSHAISDVTGLQTELDAKLDSSAYTAADVLAKTKTVDGSGSGLDADLLDGQEGSAYARSNATDTINAAWTFAAGYTQTFNDKVVFNKSIEEQIVSYGTTGSITLTISNGSYFYPTGTTTGVITFTFSGAPTSGNYGSFVLELNGAGNNDPVWPASVDWPGGTEPTWSTGIDIVTFHTRDGGTTWLGILSGLDMK